MKKIVALLMIAAMVLGAMMTVSAADLWSYNFEKDAEGAFVAVDKSLSATPKQFDIKVVTFNGSKAMRYDHTGYTAAGRNGSTDKDCFSDLFQGGTNTAWKLGTQFTLSYDLYLEKATDGDPCSCWQIGMLRLTPAAGTQFNQVAQIRGTKMYKNDKKDEDNVIAKMKTGKWYNIAVAYNMDKKTYSVYLDGGWVLQDEPWYCADTSSVEAERLRIAWGGDTGDGIAYVDNIKVISGLTPSNSTGKQYAAETTAAATTAAATTKAAAATTAAPAKTANTADAGIIIAAVAIVSVSAAIIIKKKH